MADEAAEKSRGWRGILVSWPGRVITVAVAISALWGAWLIIKGFTPADVGVRLATCQQKLITIVTTNDGGQPATVRRPIFELRSARGWDRLRMAPLLETDPFEEDDSLAEPNESDTQEYPNRRTEFFRENETEGGTCRIRVTVPIAAEGGPDRNITAECACAYQS